MNADPAEPLGQSRRTRDIDEEHEAIFLDRTVISPGDEVQEGSRSDDVGYSQSEVHQNREHRGIDQAVPENFIGHIERQSGNGLTELEPLDDNDHRCVNRAPYDQIGGEGETAEPRPHRSFQDEQLNAPEHEAYK